MFLGCLVCMMGWQVSIVLVWVIVWCMVVIVICDCWLMVKFSGDLLLFFELVLLVMLRIFVFSWKFGDYCLRLGKVGFVFGFRVNGLWLRYVVYGVGWICFMLFIMILNGVCWNMICVFFGKSWCWMGFRLGLVGLLFCVSVIVFVRCLRVLICSVL